MVIDNRPEPPSEESIISHARQCVQRHGGLPKSWSKHHRVSSLQHDENEKHNKKQHDEQEKNKEKKEVEKPLLLGK